MIDALPGPAMSDTRPRVGRALSNSSRTWLGSPRERPQTGAQTGRRKIQKCPDFER